jgi:hypothetical protein
MTKPLYRTTIVIWSDEPTTKLELIDLAREATEGNAYCSVYTGEWIGEPENDPAWDGTEFFMDAKGEADEV